MKNLLEQQRMLASMVETMSQFKNEGSERGDRMYDDYKSKCQSMIEELRDKGVSEETHPIFKNAVTTFNYWK